MTSDGRRKRIAATVAIAVHVVAFVILAVVGLFTFLQSHSQVPIEVTVYNDDAIHDEEGNAGGGPTVNIGQEALPAISETYTQTIERERKVKKLVDQGVDKETAEHQVSGQSAGQQGSMTNTVEQQEKPLGPGTSQGKVPPKKAKTISRPSGFENYMPANLKSKGVHGTITASLAIAPDGTLTVTIIQPSPYAELNAIAEQFFSQYIYEPATDENGQPVASIKAASLDY